ncbi:MAG: metallochaperone-like domain-containing protein [Cenarchaeum symbiont of Oopsacas minuta]|nr:metallochaperone-like domain-containing protein [Cenarchaeum symbiont of Oopsacas minuta]
MPTDPVCGIEFDDKVAADLAITHEHKGKTYYFCCNGCRRIFLKKPRKWKNKD